MTKTNILLIFWLISSIGLFLAVYFIAGSFQENFKNPMVSESELPSFPYYKMAVLSISAPLLGYLAWQLRELRK